MGKHSAKAVANKMEEKLDAKAAESNAASNGVVVKVKTGGGN